MNIYIYMSNFHVGIYFLLLYMLTNKQYTCVCTNDRCIDARNGNVFTARIYYINVKHV